ncbi:hypothetical protein GUITHDRAFT_117778 [Guillardia theta CCMP2712]|uniref:Uncharacterized protein n=1 Tax=Guillardia theta (strain CCMP2712) TaxID=905079 RepID=L1IIM2_GUITC|nr:hypothetical protein GUITHDRAFT_117778 [Guillardia theta CCMP2712]EKX36108.1 hypothetical protein GUITHDRAFT_117778 [Guillardia theta CCMP2712]|eukprot:XP_005823088.1 hypothetical protein GUITHDRAFT_117778 [Guillardia theta CCMP2712]
MYSGQDLVMPNKSMRSAVRRTKAVLSAVVVGVAMTALITLLYSSAKDGLSQSFMLDETSTDASGNEAAPATQVVEKGRGQGGMWDVPLPPVEKKILQPQFAAKYGEAAAAASQRMFNPVATDKNGDRVSEADARSIKARYGLVVPGSEDVFHDTKSEGDATAEPKVYTAEESDAQTVEAPTWFSSSSFFPVSSKAPRFVAVPSPLRVVPQTVGVEGAQMQPVAIRQQRIAYPQFNYQTSSSFSSPRLLPVSYSGPVVMTKPYGPVVARAIPNPMSSVYRFSSTGPAYGVSALPSGEGPVAVRGINGVGSEFYVGNGQVRGIGLYGASGIASGRGVNAAKGQADGKRLNVGSGEEAGFGLSGQAGTAAGDGIVVEEGIAQGRDITVRQGTVAGQGILIGDDGTGHGEFIGSGTGSGRDLSVSKGTAVGAGISVAEGQASGKGITVNDGELQGRDLSARKGSGEGIGISVDHGTAEGVGVKVEQGTIAGNGIYVQHGQLARSV